MRSTPSHSPRAGNPSCMWHSRRWFNRILTALFWQFSSTWKIYNSSPLWFNSSPFIYAWQLQVDVQTRNSQFFGLIWITSFHFQALTVSHACPNGSTLCTRIPNLRPKCNYAHIVNPSILFPFHVRARECINRIRISTTGWRKKGRKEYTNINTNNK